MAQTKNLKNLFGLIKEEKTVPPVDMITEHTREGIPKAYIPKFLYKPPFGYPRYVDLPNIRRLASTPFVEMCTTTIVDEISAVPWDIVLDDDYELTSQKEKEIKHVKTFFENPNTNKASWEKITRQVVRDILEIDAGIYNKIFNIKQEMVEIVARDGATFTKNPDIFGMFTDREDIIVNPLIVYPNETPEKIMGSKLSIEGGLMEPGWVTAADARERAAYFQYGWITGARPVPFGKREIVWLERNPRTDSIYGRGPVEILADAIQTLIYAIEHNLEYFNDNSIPKGIIGLDGSDTDSIKAFKEQWREAQRKKDPAGNWKKTFHHVPIVNKVPTFARIQFSNAELELLEGQRWWAKMVWACYGVTATELGYTEDAKGLSNQIVQSNVFRKRAINPILRLLEYHINKEIISEFVIKSKRDFVIGETFNMINNKVHEEKAKIRAEEKAEKMEKENKLPYQGIKYKYQMFDVEEETKKVNLYKLQVETGLKTVNEIRTEEGLDEVDWGDKPPKEWRGGENSFNFNPFNPLQQEQARREGESEEATEEEIDKNKKKEKEEKAVETKPFGEYANFAECVRKNKDKKNPEAFCAALHKKITGKWPTEKALTTENPLILREFEVPDEDKLKKSIIYVLRQNEKRIKDLIKKEKGIEKLSEIKDVSDIAKRIETITTFNEMELKNINDAVIRSTFLNAWDGAEKAMKLSLMLNKGAIQFIQEYSFNNIVGLTKEITDDIRQELQRGIMAGEGYTKLGERIEKVFDVGENRAEMIARTEVNRAEGQSSLLAYKTSGKELNKKWISAMDDRTSALCKRLHGQVVDINENFKDPKKEWEGPTHPAHVNCRSIVIYIDKEKEMKAEIEAMKKREQILKDTVDALAKKKEADILKTKEKIVDNLEQDLNAG